MEGFLEKTSHIGEPTDTLLIYSKSYSEKFEDGKKLTGCNTPRIIGCRYNRVDLIKRTKFIYKKESL
ncbi:MAG: hypothetical protein B6244_09745 [Candidatus Cloacimonetes bacterium 4572_55]|nr:MAG: hypothetical protein B6244_09745 [Candidatus Cloacimonetes bacterium 4572_55]